jgi:hypothetical protein
VSEESKSVKKKLAECAASWWLKKIKCPYQDNGDLEQSAFLSNIKHSMLNGLDGKHYDRFFVVFVKEFCDFYDKLSSGTKFNYLENSISVDYLPDEFLDKVCSGSLTEIRLLPVKTTMKVMKDHLEVKCGYGSSSEIICDLRDNIGKAKDCIIELKYKLNYIERTFKALIKREGYLEGELDKVIEECIKIKGLLGKGEVSENE